MSLLTFLPAWMWLLMSVALYAVGEYVSKNFALSPGVSSTTWVALAYAVSGLLWLPALFQKNSLAITGVVWDVLALSSTLILGLVLFREHLSLHQYLGLGFGVIAILLLAR